MQLQRAATVTRASHIVANPDLHYFESGEVHINSCPFAEELVPRWGFS
jgi:hypothetical protein